MSQYNQWYHPYPINEKYSQRVAYFSMEFGIDQALKIYSGGLGFLSGSHMRSAHDLRQNVIGVGMLWKHGYYDQERNDDLSMRIQFQKKYYSFLEDTGILVWVNINNHPVAVKALVLKPEIFGTVPVYLLTTDIHQNDYLARTITQRLYDKELAARIAQSIVLGIGGGKVVEALGGADMYHLNEGHALPLAFHLHGRFHHLEEVQKRLVFTTHTPEKAGNEEHDVYLLHSMGFFDGLPLEEARQLTGMEGGLFNYTLAALRMSMRANGVSQLHGEVARQMWEGHDCLCHIKAITNAQNALFWQDKPQYRAMVEDDDEALMARKRELKKELFAEVADQTGKLFDPNVLTVVWARRFAGYKRADLMLRNVYRFYDLINRQEQPVQFIWAGKPYPFDQSGIDTFDNLVRLSFKRDKFAVLTGHEIALSRKLKLGADVWLNTPRRPREASGTSGMTAAMNGAINFSVLDGWIPEFARHGENSFVLPVVDTSLPDHEQDDADYENLMRILEKEVIPTYYQDHPKWIAMVKQSMQDVVAQFDSDRMAREYYEIMYS